MGLEILPEVVTTYDVDGATLGDAVAAMEARGQEAGHCAFAVSFEYAGVDRRSNMTGLSVRLELRIELPRWTGRDAASAAEQAEWDRFLQALRDHEAGHASRFRTGARTLYDALAGTPANTAQTRFNSGRHRMQAESDRYDQTTDHGRRPAPGTIITIPAGP